MVNKNTNNKIGRFPWIMSSIIVPIICASISAGIFGIIINKPTTYVYKEVPTLESFNVLEYFPLEEGNYWDYKCKRQICDDGKNKITENFTVRTTVKKVCKYRDYSLVVMEGYNAPIG